MITKKNLPMCAIFFRDHEISGLGPADAEGQPKTSARQTLQGAKRYVLRPFVVVFKVTFAPEVPR
jgi:hypothetical protein